MVTGTWTNSAWIDDDQILRDIINNVNVHVNVNVNNVNVNICNAFEFPKK